MLIHNLIIAGRAGGALEGAAHDDAGSFVPQSHRSKVNFL